jgi:hypothetical protein
MDGLENMLELVGFHFTRANSANFKAQFYFKNFEYLLKETSFFLSLKKKLCFVLSKVPKTKNLRKVHDYTTFAKRENSNF